MRLEWKASSSPRSLGPALFETELTHETTVTWIVALERAPQAKLLRAVDSGNRKTRVEPRGTMLGVLELELSPGGNIDEIPLKVKRPQPQGEGRGRDIFSLSPPEIVV